MNPPSVDFQTIDVGAKSTAVNVTVTNVGTVASGPISVTVSGTGISATGCSGTTLAPKATCTIAVTAQMAVAGPISGTIEVGDTPATTKKIAVSGIAVVQGQFTVLPAPLDLGPVLVGKTVSATAIMTNTAQIGLTGVVINVSGTGFALGTGTCTDALPVGQTCNIVVNYTAGTTSGQAKGTLTVSQGGVTKLVGLTATVQTPTKFVITPTSAQFPTVFPEPSKPVTFYVTNAGDVPSAIPAVSIGGLNKDDFSQTNSCATALAGGASASCQVTVIYSPKALPTAASNATLTVAEPGTGGASVSATLTGTAVPPSTLKITGADTDFGSVVVGSASSPLTFTLTNEGGDDSGLVKLSAAAPFAIATDNCSDKNLAAKATCTFTAQFKPGTGDKGVVQGQLRATGANVANPALFPVTGTAVPQAKLSVNPNSLEFGALPTYQESEPKTLTISNSGGAPTGALKVENTGAQFKVKGDTCTGASLTATGTTSTCVVTVTFTSTGTDMDATGNIVVSDTTGAAGSVSASLHGTGTDHAGLAMDPSVICPQYWADDPLCRQSATTSLKTFKNKVVGQTTDEMALKITNNTRPTVAPDSGVISFDITGDAKGDFKIVQTNCSTLLSTYDGTLGSGTSCVLTLTFTPSAVGLRKATLVLSTTRGGATQTTLEGKGLAAFEIQPLRLDKDHNGLTFAQESLGHLNSDNVLPYRVWVRATSAADKTSTVTLTLPAATPADFIWPNMGTTTLTIGGTGHLLTPPLPAPPAETADTMTEPADFIRTIGIDTTGGVNPCHGRTVNLGLKTNNANYYYDSDSGYFACDFAVQFYPNSAKGALTAELNGNGTNSGTGKLTLSGQAVGPLVVNPSPLNDYQPVAVGQTRTTSLTLTVTNNGAAAQTGLTFELGGASAGDFQIEGTTCWTLADLGTKHALADAIGVDIDADLFPATKIDQLAQNENCLVWLGFRPKTEAEHTVTVTVKAQGGESGSATIRIAGLKTFGPLTVSPNPVILADTPYNKEDAEPVVLTIKNNGSLDTGLVNLTTPAEFEIVKETPLPAGACNVSGTWKVPGNGSCTIKVRAKPTTTVPWGIGKRPIQGILTVDDTAPNGSTVDVALSYYETSNLVVSEVGGTLASTVTYAFPAQGMSTMDSKQFTVKNVSSKDVTLSVTNQGQFSVHADPVTGLTICKTGVTLNAGGSCTLVIDDSHPAVGVVGILSSIKIDVADGAHLPAPGVLEANFASVYLSSTTVTPSILRAYGLTTGTDLLSGEAGYGTNGSGNPISLGTVPFGTGNHSGALTLWFRNLGETQTGVLSYKWNDAQEDEFAVVPPTAENTLDCLSGTKILKAKEFCSIQVVFTPKSGESAGNRTANLLLLDGDKAANAGQYVYLSARALDPSIGAWVSAGSTQGFFQFAGSTAQPGSAETGPSQLFTLHKPSTTSQVTINIPISGQFVRKMTTDTNECPAYGEVWTNATTNTCVFTLVFVPGADPTKVFNWTPNTFGTSGLRVALVDGGPAETDDATMSVLARVQQPAKLQYIPPVGYPLLTSPAGLDMLKIAIGGTTPDYTLTIVNTGDVATTPLSRGTIGTPAATGDPTFSVSEGCFTKDLKPYGTKDTSGVLIDRCTVTVKASSGTNPSDSPLRNTVTFQGQGESPLVPVPAASYGLGVRVVTAAKLTIVGTGTFTTTAVTSYQEKSLTIRNTGKEMSGKIEVPAPTGAGAAHFKVVGTSCPPNKGLPLYDAADPTTECYVAVRFAPTALSTTTDAFGATLNVNATPGSADAFSLIGMPKSALSIDEVADPTATPLKVTIAASSSASRVLTVWNDKGVVGRAAQTSPLATSLSTGSEFIIIDDQCYGKMLVGNENCTVEVKYTGAATNTEKTTTLTVNGGSAGQSVSVVVGYTGAAATTH